MSKDAVYLAWGSPERVKKGSRGGETYETWEYEGLRLLSGDQICITAMVIMTITVIMDTITVLDIMGAINYISLMLPREWSLLRGK